MLRRVRLVHEWGPNPPPRGFVPVVPRRRCGLRALTCRAAREDVPHGERRRLLPADPHFDHRVSVVGEERLDRLVSRVGVFPPRAAEARLRIGAAVIAIEPPRLDEDGIGIQKLLRNGLRLSRFALDILLARTHAHPGLVRIEAELPVRLGARSPLVLAVIDPYRFAVRPDDLVPQEVRRRAREVEIRFEAQKVHVDTSHPVGIGRFAEGSIDPFVPIEVRPLERRDFLPRRHSAEEVDRGDSEVPIVLERARPSGGARGRLRLGVRSRGTQDGGEKRYSEECAPGRDEPPERRGRRER
jgi:hypothetical protein